MPITRLTHFPAKPNQAPALHALLTDMLPIIRALSGCQSAQLLQHIDDPARLLIIETWDSVAAHQAAAQGIPVHILERAQALLAGPPTGEYYR